MESLGILIIVLFCALFLCGPFALILAHYKFRILALLVGCLAIWLGIFWFATIFTAAKWLGIISALCGLFALLKVAGDLLP
jgi:hypothetical protein